MKELIENTTTKAELIVFASIFNRVYETGGKDLEGFKGSMRIVFDKHLGQWNYIAIPELTISEVAYVILFTFISKISLTG